MRKGFLVAGFLGLGTMSRASSTPTIVTVRALDYRFEAPASVPAGTITFRLRNAGREVHHLWIVQLKDGKRPADFLEATKVWGTNLKMPDWAIDVGGPNSASPGETAEGTVTLGAGTYMLVCWVPSSDGITHVMKGMIQSLRVTARRDTTPAEPVATSTLVLADYSFTFSKPLTAGRQVVQVTNTAEQSHEVVIARLLPGSTLAEAVAWMNGGQVGRAPVEAIGGASGLAKGRHMFLTLDLTPGKYVLLCFIPDVKTGKPHSQHGMVKEITVER